MCALFDICCVVALYGVEVHVYILSHVLLARDTTFPTPNFHEYAHWFCPATKLNGQPKKVQKKPTWARTPFITQCLTDFKPNQNINFSNYIF